jgi:small-conductance mechanosensitive channel
LEQMMKKLTTLATFGLAALGMAITMPSCPGQQAMQQQIDELKVKEADLTRRLVKLEADIRTVSTDVATVKQSAQPMAEQMAALTPRIEGLEAAVKVLQTPPPAAAKGGKKKR